MIVTAFVNDRRIASGPIPDIAAVLWAAQSTGAPLLVLNNETGKVVDLDLRGSVEDIAERYALPAPKRGRPKLGVTSREISLLPRHWDWLAQQRGGASVRLRLLVEEAMRQDGDSPTLRQQQNAAYTAATVLAGDRPGYEDAMRALFSNDIRSLTELTGFWPPDIKAFVIALATGGSSK